MTGPLLSVSELAVGFPGENGLVEVVRGASLELGRGEVLGLVGETGSGKTLTGLSILRLVPPPGRIVRGRVEFDGLDILRLSPQAMRSVRGARISMVFQDPAASLNPLFTVGRQLERVLSAHLDLPRRERRMRALAGLEAVHLPDSERLLDVYPHQLSGGMQQRVTIAVALACEPDLLIADEPTTALDVTIQAQILDLLHELRTERDLTILLITHNLGIVSELCDRIAVMYAGTIVEVGATRRVLDEPLHPYTRGLLASLPTSAEPGARIPALAGSVPSPGNVPPGCPFAPRCPEARAGFDLERPPLRRVGDREVACWLYDGGPAGG